MLQQFHSLVYTKENKNTNLKKKKTTQMFTAALFRIDKIWKQPKCPSQIKKIWYTVFSHVWLFVTPWTAAPQAPCPSPTLGACSDSCPLSRWCHPTISSSVVPFSSHLQSFPASGSFPMSQLFPWYMAYNGIYVKKLWTLSSTSNSWTLSENFIWLFFPVYGSYFFLSLHLSVFLTTHSK